MSSVSLKNKIILAAPTETPIFILKTLYTNTNKRFRATLLLILHVRMRRNPWSRASLFRHTALENATNGDTTVEPRFNEVAGDRPYLFVKWRVCYIKNLDITNLRGNDQNVRYIEVIDH